jgi:mRNA-degrading endonuclease RelE of RelBE toxin-antitoxin system
MTFRIEYAPEAVDHLAGLPKRQAHMVLDQVERKLKHQPTLPSRNRKLLRANPVAPWELRLGVLRVYFDVRLEPTPLVTVRAVGVKVRDRVWIAGEEVDLG